MTDVSERAHQYLRAWHSRMPTFALMGEFSAGKSTLLNLIIGETVLPTKVTATNMPVIWMTYGDTFTTQSLSHTGKLEDFDPDDLAEQGPKGHLLIRITLPSPTLERSDIIDTPGISDRRLDANALNFIQPYLDFVVWCSAANQAWRQTEKAVWQKMPSQVQEQSILALTRADTMTKGNDLLKVVKRCTTETEGTFRAVQPIATVIAQKALGPDGQVTDQAAWGTSQAESLFTEIKDSLRIARLNCALREAVAIPDPAKDLPEMVAEEATTPSQDNPPDAEAPRKSIITEPSEPMIDVTAKVTAENAAFLASFQTQRTSETAQAQAAEANTEKSDKVDTLLCQLRQLQDETLAKEQFSTQLEHLFSKFTCDDKMSDAHQSVLNRAMSLEGSSQVPPNLVKAQLVREIEDFANNPWCQLDKVH